MKYIVLECKVGSESDLEQRVPFIFPNWMVHADVADVLTAILSQKYKRTDITVSSAGEACTVGGVECSGHSETLGVKSKDEDTALIQMYDYTNGLC